MSGLAESAERPAPDKVLTDIADYIHNHTDYSPLAVETARLCLIDTIGCGLEGLRFEHCRKLLGPVVEGTVVPNGTQPSHLTSVKPYVLTELLQARESQGQITSSTPFAVHSTSAPLFAGLTSTTVSSLRNVSSRGLDSAISR